MRKIVFSILMMFAASLFVFVGCGGSKTPNKPPEPDKVVPPEAPEEVVITAETWFTQAHIATDQHCTIISDRLSHDTVESQVDPSIKNTYSLDFMHISNFDFKKGAENAVNVISDLYTSRAVVLHLAQLSDLEKAEQKSQFDALMLAVTQRHPEAKVIYFGNETSEAVLFESEWKDVVEFHNYKEETSSIGDIISDTLKNSTEIALSEITERNQTFIQNGERRKWTNYKATLNCRSKHHVLLVGDSISWGYGPFVETELSGTTVDYIRTSKGSVDESFLGDLKMFLENKEYDVIHLNNGLHRYNQTPEQYAEGMEAVVKYMQGVDDLQIILASTTPGVLNLSTLQEDLSMKVIERNELVKAICEREGIVYNDLYTTAVEQKLPKQDKLHFKEEGSKVLASQVAQIIRDLIG